MLTSPRAIRLFITLVSQQIPSSSFNMVGNKPLQTPWGGYLFTRISYIFASASILGILVKKNKQLKTENQLVRKTDCLNLNKESPKESASGSSEECRGVLYGYRLKNLKMLLKALLGFKI